MQEFFSPEFVPESWREHLVDEWSQPYMQRLCTFLASEYASQMIFPKRENIFAALKSTPFDQVRVVLLGQDPYPGIGQAHGLSFSVQKGQPLPASLKNIFKELEDDLGITNTSGWLQPWAEQGVLLLNTILTVRARAPLSHAGKGWELFTDAIISRLIQKKKHLIFVLWGSNAKKKCEQLFREKHSHAILFAPHPSPLAAHRGFFGCSHFSKINYLLKSQNKPVINWQLP